MYKDVSKKIKIIEEELLRKNIENGEYITIDEVIDKVKKLDPYLPLHKTSNHKINEYLEADTLNKEQEQIYKDLLVLYETVYELSIKDFIEIQSMLETQTRELKRITDMYLTKTSILSNSTPLGKTIFNKKGEFKLENKIDHIEIDLGNLEYLPNSYISILVDAINMNDNNILIEIGDTRLKPYNLNKDKLKIPAYNMEINHKEFEFNENELLSIPMYIPIDNENEIKNNIYYLSSGKNKVTIKDSDISRLVDLDNLYFEERTHIEFYCLNASSLTITSNKELEYSNVDIRNTPILINDYSKKISLTVNPGTILNISIDKGVIYGTRCKAIILNNKLYYNTPVFDKTFLIDEIKNLERIPMSTKIKIYNTKNTIIDVKEVSIKEMDNIGGDMFD